jgi:hypothetical protein
VDFSTGEGVATNKRLMWEEGRERGRDLVWGSHMIERIRIQSLSGG